MTNDWLPISTCPKQADAVLLANEHGVWVGKYVERFTSGYRPRNPWRSLMLNHRHAPELETTVPTKWMPLPPPPQKAEA